MCCFLLPASQEENNSTFLLSEQSPMFICPTNDQLVRTTNQQLAHADWLVLQLIAAHPGSLGTLPTLACESHSRYVMWCRAATLPQYIYCRRPASSKNNQSSAGYMTTSLFLSTFLMVFYTSLFLGPFTSSYFKSSSTISLKALRQSWPGTFCITNIIISQIGILDITHKD